MDKKSKRYGQYGIRLNQCPLTKTVGIPPTRPTGNQIQIKDEEYKQGQENFPLIFEGEIKTPNCKNHHGRINKPTFPETKKCLKSVRC